MFRTILDTNFTNHHESSDVHELHKLAQRIARESCGWQPGGTSVWSSPVRRSVVKIREIRVSISYLVSAGTARISRSMDPFGPMVAHPKRRNPTSAGTS